MELVDFLNARLDEDEAAAKAAACEGGTWKQDDPDRRPGAISSLGGPVVYDEGSPDEHQAEHIARHDPARVLREVEAKRAIVAEHSPPANGDYPRERPYCGSCGEWVPCKTLSALAAVWSDHPDHRQEWHA